MKKQQILKNGESNRKINLLSPYDFIDKIKIKIKKEWKIAFISTIIIGLITHMFIMVNNLPNHDGLLNIVGNQEHIELGRWFLKFACLFSSYFTIPWIIGIISILLLGLTSVVIIEIFNIKEKINIILISAILVVFPTIASGFAYIFTLDGYIRLERNCKQFYKICNDNKLFQE